MQKNTTIFVLLILASLCLNAQQMSRFQKTIGGTADEFANTVIETADGGFIILGRTNSFGSGDYNLMLTRTDDLGNVLWAKTYGGSGEEGADYSAGPFSSMIQGADSTYIIASSTKSYGAGNADVYLLKVDKTGNVIWTRTYGGTGNEVAISVAQLAGGYAVAGMTSSYGSGSRDAFLLTTNDTGGLVWFNAYGGTNEEYVYSMIVSSVDSSFYISGESSSGTISKKAMLLKIHRSGRRTWSKVFGSNSLWEVMMGITEDARGDIYLAGQSEGFSSGGGDMDLYMVKMDSSGRVVWGKTYGIASFREGGRKAVLKDGYIYWNGWQRQGGNFENLGLFLKLDTSGAVSWFRRYPVTSGYFANSGTNQIALRDGDIMTVAAIKGDYSAGGYDYFLLKTDTSGTGGACSTSVLTPTVRNGMPNFFNHNFQTQNASASVSEGYSSTAVSPEDSSICEHIIVGMASQPTATSNVKVYPNPAGTVLNVDVEGAAQEFLISLYSADGRQVLPQVKSSDKTTVLMLEGLPSGLYFLQVASQDGMQWHRVVKK